MAVQFKFTGDDKDVQRALERMTKQYNALIATTKKGTDETKKMAEAAKKAFDETRTPMERYKAKMEEINALAKAGAIDQETLARAAKKAADELAKSDRSGGGLAKAAMSAAAGYLSVAAAVAAVNSALERKNELERTAADKQQDMANKQREALINLGTATKSERQEILGGVAGIATRTGVKQGDLMAALPGLTSGQGALSTKAMLSALNVAARVAPHDNETLASVALGLENTASLTGSDDMMENMGFQLGLGRRSQVKSLKGINEYVIPGAIGVKGHGGSASEAAAFVTALGIGMKDSEGRVQSTAGASAAKQLADFLPMQDTYKWDDKGRRKLDRRGTGLASTDERIAFMQSHPEERGRFMAEGSFEQRALIPTRDALTPGTEVARMYDLIKKETQQGAGAKATATDFVGMLEADAMQQDAGAVRKGDAIVEKMQLDDTAGGRNARARKMMTDMLDTSGDNFFSKWNAGVAYDLDTRDPETAAISQLEKRKMRFGFDRPGQDATAEDKRRIAGIDEVIAELRKISSQQKSRDPDRHAE